MNVARFEPQTLKQDQSLDKGVIDVERAENSMTTIRSTVVSLAAIVFIQVNSLDDPPSNFSAKRNRDTLQKTI
ncbi:hypothetical protein C4G53_RS21725 [Vibrio parahaemolyticus]|nr:hypothetical protein [Vibrio parahaemolyticus]